LIEITELDRKTLAAPAQWYGLTKEGEEVYIRFRHDKLSVRVDEDDPVNGEEIFSDVVYEGVLRIQHLADILENSDNIKVGFDYKEEFYGYRWDKLEFNGPPDDVLVCEDCGARKEMEELEKCDDFGDYAIPPECLECNSINLEIECNSHRLSELKELSLDL
jgi:hypothetical protein